MRNNVYLSVGKLVGLLKAGAGSGGGHLLLEVKSDVAELLLDVSHDLSLGRGGEAEERQLDPHDDKQ